MVTLLDDAHALLGEGPIWVAQEDCFYWVDIKGRWLNRYHLASKVTTRWRFSENLAWVLPSQAGGFVAGTRRQIGTLTIDKELSFTPYVTVEPDLPGNRLNDAKIDIDGTILFGTMDDDEREATGSLYRLLSDFSFAKLDTGYVVANGPAASTAVVYHTDSAARRIYSFERAGERLVNKQVFVEFQENEGYPDGMTMDAQGGLWVAHWGGARVSRFLPDGSRERSLNIPASQVTSCCFGGVNMDELFITTAAIGLGGAELQKQPHAGGVFMTKVGVKGVASPIWNG